METIRLGRVTISGILEHQKPSAKPEEFFVPFDADRLCGHLPTLPPGQFDATEGRLIFAFHTFVVRTPTQVILVDTCNGEGKPHQKFDTSPWLAGLHALGLGVEDIDVVMCTHLHVDHTGWNTTLENGRWVPTFPNATYIFGRREYDYWEAAVRSGAPRDSVTDGIWEMNCLPVVETGQAQLVEDDWRLDEHVSLIPSPGHSPGHCCVMIHADGHEAIVIGDMMHSVIQCLEPDWSTRVCWDPELAARSRRHWLDHAARARTLILPIHFPAPTAGRVEADGNAFRYRFHGT